MHCRPRGWLSAALLLAVILAGGGRAAGESPQERRQRVAALSPAEKDELRRKWERFQRLDPAEQARLRELHAQLRADAQGRRLEEVMFRYDQWLQTLSGSERVELLKLPAADRVEAVKALLQKRERERFQELAQTALSQQDRDVIFDWLTSMARDKLPPLEQRRLEQIDNPRRRRVETLMAFRRRFGSHAADQLRPDPNDVQGLIERLSPQAQQALGTAQNDQEQRMIVRRWFSAAFFSRRPPAAQDDLKQFFQRLDEADREYLQNLPPPRMREELERRYWQQRLNRFGEGRPFEPPR